MRTFNILVGHPKDQKLEAELDDEGVCEECR